MFLLVTNTGGKWWRLKYRIAGIEKQLSLGTYPDVALEEARKQRDDARKLLTEGIDPGEKRKAQKAAIRAEKAVRLAIEAVARAEEARQLLECRFRLSNEGGLTFRLGNRRINLTPDETAELRTFLDAARDPTPMVTPCP